jgi:hypothetical protein
MESIMARDVINIAKTIFIVKAISKRWAIDVTAQVLRMEPLLT